MRQMARGVLFLLLLVGAAVAARADVTPVDLGSSSNDFKVVVNASPCDADICVDLTYTGPAVYVSIFNPIIFWANPLPTPVPSGQTVGCGSDVFQCIPWTTPLFSSTPTDFWSVWFFGGWLVPGHTYEVGESNLPSLQLTLPSDFTCETCAGPDIVFTPELPTYALFGTGLLLVLGGMFWRRKMGLHVAVRREPRIPATEV